MLELSRTNTLFEIDELNKFRIGDEVIADATDAMDRFQGIIVSIGFDRIYSSTQFRPNITLLHDGCLTDGFEPKDLRKVDPASLQTREIGK